jgi:hypothetical protein
LILIASLLTLVTQSWVLFWIGVSALVLLAWAFAVASVQARVGPRVLLALLIAPGYVVWKLAVQTKALFGLRGGLKEFGATERQ